MIFMHIYALFAQNRRCPLTGWRKHAHPPPRKRIPEKRFENFQLSEPSRTLAPRRLHILFFLSLTPVYPFPRCRLSRGPECSRPPIFDSAYIYIYTDQYTQDTYIYTHRLQSVDWPSLPFFLFFFFFCSGYRKSGIKRMMVTKREKTSRWVWTVCSMELARSLVRCCACARAGVIRYIGEQRHSNVTKGRNFVNFFSRRAAHRGGN